MKKQVKWLVIVSMVSLFLVGCNKEDEPKDVKKETPIKETVQKEKTKATGPEIEEVEVMRVYDEELKGLAVGTYIKRIDYFVDEVTNESVLKDGVTHMVSVRLVGNGSFHTLPLTEKTTLLQDVIQTIGKEKDEKRMTVCEEKGKESCQFDRLILDENGHHYNIAFTPEPNGDPVLYIGDKPATE